MRKALLLLIGVLAIAGATTPATAQRSATVNVSITAVGFNPEDATIKPGDTVTWRNNDSSSHQVVSDTGAFRSQVLKPSETYSFRFTTEASYSYHDGMKPEMTGTVNAVESNVTAAVTRLQLVYGSSVRVFGSIPSGRSGEQVTIHVTPYGKQETTKVVSTDQGVYELMYRPTIRTQFFATWDNTTSQRSPTINVRPSVVFSPLNAQRNRFYVRVRPAKVYASNLVRIQRLNNKGIWVTKTKVRLNSNAFKRFTDSFPRGATKARAWIGAHPGYAVGLSTTRTIFR